MKQKSKLSSKKISACKTPSLKRMTKSLKYKRLTKAWSKTGITENSKPVVIVESSKKSKPPKNKTTLKPNILNSKSKKVESEVKKGGELNNEQSQSHLRKPPAKSNPRAT